MSQNAKSPLPKELSAALEESSLRGDPLAARVVRLIEQKLPPTPFYKELLVTVADEFGAHCGALELRMAGQVINHSYHREGKSTIAREKLLNEGLTDALSKDRPRTRTIAGGNGKAIFELISSHLPTPHDQKAGAITIILPTPDEGGIQDLLARLDEIAYLTLYYAKLAQPGKDGGKKGGSSQAQSLRKLATCRSPMELAMAITNNLRTKANCDQVAFGKVRGKSVEVYAVSGLDEVKRRNPGIQRIEAAMLECLDHGSPLAVQSGEIPPELGGPRNWMLHKAWQESAGHASVATIPLEEDGQLYGLVSLRRQAGAPFQLEEIEKYAELVVPYAQGLSLVERANRSWLNHGWNSLLQGLRRMGRVEHWRATTFWLLGIAVSIWLIFGTTPHVVTTRCVVVPKAVRHFGAPFDGVLRRAPHVAGDRVKAGELLASFDTKDLELEAARLRSELEISRIEERRALGDGQSTEAFVAQTHRRSWEAQLALVEQKLALAEVRAPFDGALVAGDLRDRVGDRVTKGEDLFELTQDQQWRLELWVPEGDVASLRAGQEGSFVTLARPGTKHEIELRRILPSTQVQEGQSTYVAEAEWDAQIDWIRPGMEGFARVQVGERKVWRAGLDRVVRWLQLHFWI